MPTFCRHNRFIERCPVCSKTLPGNEPAGGSPRRARSGAASGGAAASTRRRVRGEGLKVRREGRAAEDGYQNELVPGMRASSDALRLADEIAFSSARLAGLATEPPGLFAQVAAVAGGDLERATWICFLIAYLGPVEGDDPFAAIESLLAQIPAPGSVGEDDAEVLDAAERGPRGSGGGLRTLMAYRQWIERAGGEGREQAVAFRGDAAWTPQRRFARIYERLALPGFTRAGRYELLVCLGRLGLYEMSADSLHFSAARGEGEDPATTAAKRVFGIADPLLLDRRAASLAASAGAPLEALDLALANWLGPQRSTAGLSEDEPDQTLAESARAALGV